MGAPATAVVGSLESRSRRSSRCAGPEGKTPEFKRDLPTSEGALKTIVAFANAAGRTLLLGVEDKSRHVRGVHDPVDLEERLANLISDLVVPRLVPEVIAFERRRPDRGRRDRLGPGI